MSSPLSYVYDGNNVIGFLCDVDSIKRCLRAMVDPCCTNEWVPIYCVEMIRLVQDRDRQQDLLFLIVPVTFFVPPLVPNQFSVKRPLSEKSLHFSSPSFYCRTFRLRLKYDGGHGNNTVPRLPERIPRVLTLCVDSHRRR